MNKLLITALMVLPSVGFSQVMTKNVYNCSYWINQNGYYVCGSYPMMEQTVDVYSLNYKIRELENRLNEIEKKLANHP